MSEENGEPEKDESLLDKWFPEPSPNAEFDKSKKYSDFIGMLMRLVVLAFGAVLTYDLSLEYNPPADVAFKGSSFVFAALAVRMVIAIQAVVAEWVIRIPPIENAWLRILVRMPVALVSYLLASGFLLAISFPIVALVDERGTKTKLMDHYLMFFGEDPATARKIPPSVIAPPTGNASPD
jgi:hypothetical protein